MSGGQRTALALLAPSLAACLSQPPGATAADAAPADGAPPPGDQQLLANPDFEEGEAGWTIEGSAAIGDPDSLMVSIAAASGTRFAQTGRKNLAVDGIRQVVAVPAWAAALRLDGQRCFDTEDQDLSPDDVVRVVLLDAGGAELEVLLSASNAEIGAVCSWSGFAATAAESHAGETVQLAIRSQSDGADLTAFWFDDLRLLAARE
jgi:hypothetical protein